MTCQDYQDCHCQHSSRKERYEVIYEVASFLSFKDACMLRALVNLSDDNHDRVSRHESAGLSGRAELVEYKPPVEKNLPSRPVNGSVTRLEG